VEQGLRALQPDVVALQEVRVVPDRLPNQAETLARALGLHVIYAPSIPWGGGEEGLAILSRVPIEMTTAIELPHATDMERRLLLSARLAFETGPLWVHDTHLNYRLHHGKQREDQVKAIVEQMATCTPDNPQLLLGDFNARPDSDEIRWLSGLTSLGAQRVHHQDAWALLHPGDPGWTWARRNPHTKSLAFLEPDRRLDYVFVTTRRRDGRGTIHDCRLVFDQPDEAGLFASDHFGLMADVQITAD
jgi:endonuclease/exonuclease/phosphatase family metal-dependent hydrolase